MLHGSGHQLRNILLTRNIPDIKVVTHQLGHPLLFITVQLQLCQNVSQRILVHPNCEFVAFKPVTELVADWPLAGKSNGSGSCFTNLNLRQNSTYAIQGCIS